MNGAAIFLDYSGIHFNNNKIKNEETASSLADSCTDDSLGRPNAPVPAYAARSAQSKD